MIKRGKKIQTIEGAITPEMAAALAAERAAQMAPLLPPLYADGIQVEPGAEVAIVTFMAQGQPIARLALSASLVADMPNVWQTAAARMGVFERNGTQG